MSESDPLDPVAFGAAFKKFVDNMNTTAAKEANPLVERLKSYLGDEPGRVPIVALAAIGGSAAVKHEHLDSAMSELGSGSDLAKRIVGFGSGAYLPPAPSVGPMRPAGFPTATVEVKPPTHVKRPPA